MKEYRPKKGKYTLPAPVYFQAVWLIRGYYYYKDMADAIIDESPGMGDGMPHGGPSPDGVFNKATRRMKYTAITDMIDKELAKIPQEYRQGVWDNIIWRTAFPMDAGRATYARWKSRFIYRVAERQGLV